MLSALNMLSLHEACAAFHVLCFPSRTVLHPFALISFLSQDVVFSSSISTSISLPVFCFFVPSSFFCRCISCAFAIVAFFFLLLFCCFALCCLFAPPPLSFAGDHIVPYRTVLRPVSLRVHSCTRWTGTRSGFVLQSFFFLVHIGALAFCFKHWYLSSQPLSLVFRFRVCRYCSGCQGILRVPTPAV